MPPPGSRRHVPEKVIDSWVYKVKDVEFDVEDYIPEEEREDEDSPQYKRRKERVRNKIVKVELRMEKTTKQSEEAPHPLDTVKLSLVCPELKIKLEGTDVESLRATMWSMLDKKYEIKWEPYFLVEISHSYPYTGLGTGLTFSYKNIYKGTTWDGKSLLKVYRGGSYGSSDKIEPWPGAFTNKNGNVIACIQETDANRDALTEFSRRIDVLRQALAGFLKPETILQTLTDMAGLRLLPPAPEKKTVLPFEKEM